MKITEQHIQHIENALGFKLYENQRNYLLDTHTLRGGRASGKTTAICIQLSLSDGEPLDLRRPWEFSDGLELGSSHKRYSLGFFRHNFMEIRGKLKDYGFKVIGIKEVRR